MFTGIIKEIGTVNNLNSSGLLEIQAEITLQGLSVGDSVAVNGCCLTVIKIENDYFQANVVEETLQCTTLGELKKNEKVNLERPLPFHGKVDGHFVQGHVDGKGSILSKVVNKDGSVLVTISTLPSMTRYIVEKGSIAVDGVSLTAFSVEQDRFSFAMIPHTAQETILGSKLVGALVNLEADMLAKHVEKFAQWNKE